MLLSLFLIFKSSQKRGSGRKKSALFKTAFQICDLYHILSSPLSRAPFIQRPLIKRVCSARRGPCAPPPHEYRQMRNRSHASPRALSAVIVSLLSHWTHFSPKLTPKRGSRGNTTCPPEASPDGEAWQRRSGEAYPLFLYG